MKRENQVALLGMVLKRDVEHGERCVGCGQALLKGDMAYCSEDERYVFCCEDCRDYVGGVDG